MTLHSVETPAAESARRAPSLAVSPFGNTAEGTPVELYTLRNELGMEARIATYGGILVSLTAPDRDGHFADVVLGLDSLEGYREGSAYFGALIGRYANRIAGGHFTLEGVRYTLPRNDGQNSLHGGKVGFDKVVWKVASSAVTERGPQLVLAYRSRDREQGYPGTVDVRTTYTLGRADNVLAIEFVGTTDKPTVLNLTAHSYFNLRGSGDVLGHRVEIHAQRFTPVDRTLIPTGDLVDVAGTPFDFRQPHAIGQRITGADEQLRFGRGYDHNWVLDGPSGTLRVDARVYEPTSGRVLEVLSDQPGLQFYSGNLLDGTIKGKGGIVYRAYAGFCMEPQHFPDSPNHGNFPSTELRPGETYASTIVYRFGAK